MKITLLVALCVACFSSASWAATYYVSSSAGSDSNTGTAASSPWKTVSKVNSVKFAPGDQVLFLRGDVWRDNLNPGASGSSTAPITFGAYGTGNKPSFRGSNTYNSTSNWIQESGNVWYLASVSKDPGVFAHDGVLGQRRLQKSGLAAQWDYWYDATNYRVYVYSTSNPATLSGSLEVAVRQYVIGPQWASFIIFDNIDVRHAYGIGWLGWGSNNVTFRNCNFTQGGGDHILFHNGSQNGLVTNCTFDNWGIGAGQYYAIHTQGTSTLCTGPIDVADNSFTFSSIVEGAVYTQPSPLEHTALMQDTNSWVRNVQRNTIDGMGHMNDDGLVIWDSGSAATSHLIEGNVIKNIGGIAILIQQLENHGAHPAVTVRYNRMENVCLANTLDKSALRLRSFSTASPVSVYYNVINKTQQGSNGEPGIDISGASGAKLYNNTIYGTDTGILVRNSSTGTVGNNNLIFGNRGNGIKVDTSSWITADYDCMSANAAGNYSGISPGAHDILTDPLVVNATSGDFHLSSKSPCIDKGYNDGLVKDIASDPVPYGPATDMGAFEYTVLMISPPSILGIQ